MLNRTSVCINLTMTVFISDVDMESGDLKYLKVDICIKILGVGKYSKYSENYHVPAPVYLPFFNNNY
jgi:hypothetical protein